MMNPEGVKVFLNAILKISPLRGSGGWEIVSIIIPSLRD